jgi:phage terminase small subunit
MAARKKTGKEAKKKHAKVNGLTVKQEKFCQLYVELGDASAAYRGAYSAGNMKPKVVAVKACELLKHGNVSVRVDDLQKKLTKIAEDRYLVTQERIIGELAKIAFANAEDYFEWGNDGVKIKESSDLTQAQRSVIAEISQTKTKDGGSIKIKLSDKQTALEKLGRTLGMFKDKGETNINIGIEAIVFASVARREARANATSARSLSA